MLPQGNFLKMDAQKATFQSQSDTQSRPAIAVDDIAWVYHYTVLAYYVTIICVYGKYVLD